MDHRLKLRLMLLALVGAGIILLLKQQRQAQLGAEMQSLREELAELRSENQNLLNRVSEKRAREATSTAAATPVEPATPAAGQEAQGTNFFARFGKEPPKLTPEQVTAYLNANGRKASTLLAAYRTSGETALLQEAMQTYPTEPQVAFEALFQKDLTPEQRRQWLDAFVQAAPDNPLANYLSARDYFKAGQTDQALKELAAAAGKQRFQDYTLDRRQDDEEAYLAAGYSAGAAKLIASGQVLLPQLSQLKQLGGQVVELAQTYRQAGDETSARALLQQVANLGQSYGVGDCAISHLVGIAIERNALNALEPGTPYGGAGQTVQERLNELAQQKAAVKALFEQGNGLLESMSEQDWISYIDREKASGEQAAMQWAVSKFGRK